MDNLTHTLTGLMLARAGIGKSVPRAGLLLMLAANAPDLDIVTALGGSLAYLEYHRWFTHSVLAIPLLAALAAGLTRIFARKPGPYPWIPALLAAAIGVSSHLLMDWTNVYGIRLLLPFSPAWFRGDITHIFDLFIWTVLLVATIAPALGQLVSSEIGAKPGTGRGWAVFALLLLGGYEYGRYLAHDRALAVLNSRVYEGAAAVRVAAFPTFWNPLRWRGVVETGDAYRIFALNLGESFDPAAGTVLFKAQPNSAMAAAGRTLPFQRFLSFSPFPVWRTFPVSSPEGATEVELSDLRFGDPRQSGFVASAIVDQSNRAVSSGFSFTRTAPK